MFVCHVLESNYVAQSHYILWEETGQKGLVLALGERQSICGRVQPRTQMSLLVGQCILRDSPVGQIPSKEEDVHYKNPREHDCKVLFPSSSM